jgi:FHS family L-fucose permease-like MFS transporter
MAIVGGALLPELDSAIADEVGLRMGFILPALCYLYIVFYGLKGSEQRLRAAEAKAA